MWRKLLRTLRRLTDETTVVVLAHFTRYPEAERNFWRWLDADFTRRRVPAALLSPQADRTAVYVLRRKEAHQQR